jgi:hypothetical protein
VLQGAWLSLWAYSVEFAESGIANIGIAKALCVFSDAPQVSGVVALSDPIQGSTALIITHA